MRIAGYQPLSLLDFPGRVAAVVFTQGCPLRCVFCHNPELLPVLGRARIEEGEILARLAGRADFIDGVVVTGGEPTAQPDLPKFLAGVKALGLETKLDTNGVHPRMVERVLRDGLVDFVAMDLKHVWERYPEAVGRSQTIVAANCRETMRIIQSSGVEREFRTTVCPALHGVRDLETIADELVEGDRYALQEMRYGGTLDPDLPRATPVDLEAAAARIRAAHPWLQVEIRT